MKKDKRKIPKGSYCYQVVSKIGLQGVCPYWSSNPKKPKQNNGYCTYLEKGDWEINKEKRWRKVEFKDGKEVKHGKWETAYQIGIPMSLLWDMCKECNINE